MTLQSIAVFCGAHHGVEPIYANTTRDFGRACATRGIRVVYGGGHIGLMGVLADAALKAKGEVVGVIPRDLQDRELAHTGLTTMHVVDGMHERKALMGALADAFVALPGGFGTLEEFFEVITWAQLHFHDKPCGLLNVAGYFDGLLAFLDHGVAQGFIAKRDRALVQVANDGDTLLASLTPGRGR